MIDEASNDNCARATRVLIMDCQCVRIDKIPLPRDFAISSYLVIYLVICLEIDRLVPRYTGGITDGPKGHSSTSPKHARTRRSN
jgi:hypothetical protein